jgi:hypothetical protein
MLLFVYNGLKPWNLKDHALVEYNGLKPLNRIIKPMLHTLSSQSLYYTNVRYISLKLLKIYHNSHGQDQDRLTLMNKPSEKRFAQFIQSIIYMNWSSSPSYKMPRNQASNESDWGQKTLKI